MEPRAFCSQSHVVIVAGKGGVGKTTVSVALALVAARAGLRTLVVEVEATSAIGSLFDRPGALGYEQVTLRTPGSASAEIVGRTITPDRALSEYLDEHGFRRISRRMSSTGTLELVSTAIPGIKDILVLGKIKQIEQASVAVRPGRQEPARVPHAAEAVDLIVVDAPAAGHAITFLGSARGLLDAASVGPIRTQAADVMGLIGDPARCQVLLVTLPEETPVREAVETAFHLEDKAGVLLGPVVVNGLYPTLDLPADARLAATDAGVELDDASVATLQAAAEFRRRRQELQALQVRRLSSELPLPQLRLPQLWTTDMGPAQVEELADALEGAVRALPAPGAASSA